MAHLESSLVKTDNAAFAQDAAILGPTAEAKNATCKAFLNSETSYIINLQQPKQMYNNDRKLYLITSKKNHCDPELVTGILSKIGISAPHSSGPSKYDAFKFHSTVAVQSYHVGTKSCCALNIPHQICMDFHLSSGLHIPYNAHQASSIRCFLVRAFNQ